MNTISPTRLVFGSIALHLVQPISTDSGRKYVEALPQVHADASGSFMAVGYEHAFMVYRASVGALGTNWSFVCFGPTSI